VDWMELKDILDFAMKKGINVQGYIFTYKMEYKKYIYRSEYDIPCKNMIVFYSNVFYYKSFAS